MYELIDARTHGQDIERPFIIVDMWRSRRRKVYDFPPDQEHDARETLRLLNEFVYGENDDSRGLNNAA